MNRNEQGGAAFPISHSDKPGAYEAECGMSLREYYMAHAPISMEDAMQAAQCYPSMSKDQRPNMWKAMAELRAEYADAMLAARGKP